MKKNGLTISKTFTLLALSMVLTIPGIQTARADIQQKAVSINAAADYTSGTHSVISVDPVGGPRDIQNDLQPTVSDLGLNAYGRYFYVIERYYGDNVTKYDISNPSTPIWQFSTMDENDAVATSNPHNIVFAGPTKAYLLRHNSASAWIINPGTTDEQGFRTGYMDLSAYNDQDEYGPEMTDGVIVDNQLFVVLQRLNQDDSSAPNTAYLAVIDITTDQEIDTGMGGDLKGIELPVKNPSAIEYDPETGLIFVQGVGKYASSWSGTPAEYSGGIATIDPTTFETTLLIDDGDDENHPYGNISGMTVLSATKGYFVGYAGWGDNTMYEFNPTSGEVVGEANEYLKNKNIAGMNAGASADQNGMVWITNATDAEIVILNPTDNTIDEKINTNINPSKIVFVTGDDSEEDSSGGGGGGGCFINTLSSSRTSSGSMPLFMGGLLVAVMLVAINRRTRVINKK